MWSCTDNKTKFLTKSNKTKFLTNYKKTNVRFLHIFNNKIVKSFTGSTCMMFQFVLLPKELYHTG